MNITTILSKLVRKEDLHREESNFLLSEIMRGNVSEANTAAILTALSMKGEAIEEIVSFIHTMRKNMLHITCADAIDVCGTGGDGKQTFNISTAVSFVVAGTGIKIAKHGNRAASSHCGSADILEELGVHITLTPEQAEEVLQKTGMVFLFAPLFHPAMKSVSTVRKEIKIRTVFNYLGPFCNPASVTKQLIGVPSINVAEKLIQVAQQLDYQHLIIATSEEGLDEISITHKTYLYELKNGSISRSMLHPEEYGFDYTEVTITGGSAAVNADILKHILEGSGNQYRDIVLLNSAVAIYVSGKTGTIQDGLELAKYSIDSGNAKKVLEHVIKETQKYA